MKINSSDVAALNLFKVMVAKSGKLHLEHVNEGFVTDFKPTAEQLATLRRVFKPLSIVTLFSVKERTTAPVEELLVKQLLHYIEVYGLNTPGLFDLEVRKGEVVKIAYVKAVTRTQLQEMVLKLSYANRPLADVKPVIELIKHYDVDYNINAVANNELRIALFNINRDTFTSGDDAVRYICHSATGEPLLIKSLEVIRAVKERPVSVSFLEHHVVPLAQVFNRHKRLIMACKNKFTAKVINKISRLSKTMHVPLVESDEKTIVSRVLNGSIELESDRVKRLSLRAKFKLLNYIEYKKLQLSFDVFTIRNGKTWFEDGRPTLDPNKLEALSAAIVKSLAQDLKPLCNRKILLDPSVEYGLPISRKQALGNLPYGTKVITDKKKLSAGIYWHNDFATIDESGYRRNVDLDLSAINSNGKRTGWGSLNGYTSDKIVFSGDMVDASRGATEFMVVNTDNANRYGLMVNIFSYSVKSCDFELVVGHPNGKVWQDNTLIRERSTLTSKQCIIGFLKDNTFVVYSGRLNNQAISHGKHPVIDKGLGKLWTVTELLDKLKIKFDVSPLDGVTYDHDLRYQSFTLDKLEALFNI